MRRDGEARAAQPHAACPRCEAGDARAHELSTPGGSGCRQPRQAGEGQRRIVGQWPVDVVLDDQPVVAPGDRGEFAPALLAQRDCRRIVQRRHEEYRARAKLRASRLEGVRPHATAIHGNAPEIKPVHAAERIDALVGHLVGQHHLALPGDGAKNAVQAMLGAGGEHDAARVAFTGDRFEPTTAARPQSGPSRG